MKSKRQFDNLRVMYKYEIPKSKRINIFSANFQDRKKKSTNNMNR